MNDPNIHHNMIKVHVKYSNFINHKVTHASETSLALGISKIALGHLSFNVLHDSGKKELTQKING